MIIGRLDPKRLEEVCVAIADNSARLLAGDYSHTALERRWREIGGMLELAHRLEDQRLVRALEVHKDALRRRLDSS